MMSYEGSDEYLCANGHYTCVDCWTDRPARCGFCEAPIAYWHSIDETNGEDDTLPSTKPAPKQQTGWDDDWKYDHYGNRYATKVIRYAPGAHWIVARQLAAHEQDESR